LVWKHVLKCAVVSLGCGVDSDRGGIVRLILVAARGFGLKDSWTGLLSLVTGLRILSDLNYVMISRYPDYPNKRYRYLSIKIFKTHIKIQLLGKINKYQRQFYFPLYSQCTECNIGDLNSSPPDLE
jgi:hypothetical protein